MGDEGVKFDGGKVDMTNLPVDFLIETARALNYGAQKYDRWNFLKVEGAGQRYSAALLRHFTAWMGGEDIDPESGLLHLACVSANLAMLIACEAHGVNIGSWREPELSGEQGEQSGAEPPPPESKGSGIYLESSTRVVIDEVAQAIYHPAADATAVPQGYLYEDERFGDRFGSSLGGAETQPQKGPGRSLAREAPRGGGGILGLR